MINANFGDYDLVQVNDNEFKKVFHENAQGHSREYFLLDYEVEIVKSVIELIEIAKSINELIEDSRNSDEISDGIQYLEEEFFHD